MFRFLFYNIQVELGKDLLTAKLLFTIQVEEIPCRQLFFLSNLLSDDFVEELSISQVKKPVIFQAGCEGDVISLII